MSSIGGTRFRVESTPAPAPQQTGRRIDAIDILRGIALVGMLAVHSLIIFNEDGTPTFVTQTAAGRSFAIFAVLAGVSLALMTGASRPVSGAQMSVRRAGIAARALYIALVGTVLGYITVAVDVRLSVILVYYGVLFLVALPFLRLPARALGAFTALGAVLAPLAIYFFRPVLHHTNSEQETLVDLFVHPVRFLSEIFVIGTYPVIALLVFALAGLLIGRQNLRNKALAIKLVVVGAVMAAGSWVASSLLLFNYGGLDELFAKTTSELNSEVTKTTVLWWPQEESATPWELAQRVGHSNTTFDMVHSIGIAAALLGVLLLATRSPLVSKALSPLAAAGSMPLTIYTMQIGLLAIWKFDMQPYSLYFYVMVAVSLTFAVVWRKYVGQGPLEKGAAYVARTAAKARKRQLEPAA